MSKASLKALSEALAARLTNRALPGELQGFGPDEQAEAAAFLAATAERRPPATVAIALEQLPGDAGARRQRLAIVNDDMPFLVDSIAAAIVAHDIAIDRIIHPVISVTRGADGVIKGVSDGEGARESMIYIEMQRADARERRDLTADLEEALADVRVAVADWRQMQATLAADAGAVEDTGGSSEGAALMRWFLDRHFTLLGHERWYADGRKTDATLGIARNRHKVPLLADRSRELALAWFAKGGEAPLMLKSSLISPVHRRVPIDVILVPIVEGGKCVGLSLHAGLWTSAALTAPPRAVPVLRQRLADLEAKLGFDPAGHTGKALAHAMGTLPHDLVIAFDADSIERLTLTAMSIADRPRPKLVLVASPLGRQLVGFVWLPRDELTTARRLAIGDMISEAAGGSILNWTVAMEDGNTALIRYTVDLRASGKMPDSEPLDAQLEKMVRGWVRDVEAALVEQVPAPRAARLALRWAAAFPLNYRTGSTAEEAADDVLRLAELDGPADRQVLLYPAEAGAERRLKIYKAGGPLALSDAVPVLENFGFRVIGEMPTRLREESDSHIHDFSLDTTGATDAIAKEVLEGAIAAVLKGEAENDGFNRLMLDVGLSPGSVVLLRAWFRYLRQAGVSYGLATVVDALARAPRVTQALIALFTLRHQPGAKGDIA
ncbi:MAG: NAD-glutamate dehydrogenase, partial [Sphingomonadales bacterium]|nr:NAD-glutamate dehydrogenase [Sphingomonadales bacterium]